MTKLLVRLFIKNSENVEEPKVRGAYGVLAGIVGIICNVILFLGKLIIGTVSGSVSITADAINNLSDASSNIVTLVGFRLAQKPEDAEHPYGHARIEYLSGLAVAALILIIGVQLAKDSFLKILNPEPVDFSLALVLVLVLSIGVKLWMALFNRTLGKKIDSTSLIATAADSRNDVISTGAVLLAAVVAHLSGLNLDGYVGFLVALFILYSGIGIAKETISPLLGASADPELTHLVRHEVLNFDPRILGVHDLMVHDYGPGQTFATIHVEVDRNEDVMEVHNMIDNAERHMLKEHRIHLTIHYDPIVTDNAEVTRLKEKVGKILKDLDPRLTYHDFRMVEGPEHTNLIFDVVLPYDLQGQEKRLQEELNEALQEPGKRYYTVITFDMESFNQ
jgi:cation diffusion facilitator family transporter